jgi:hypothetical protein
VPLTDVIEQQLLEDVVELTIQLGAILSGQDRKAHVALKRKTKRNGSTFSTNNILSIISVSILLCR